MEIKLDYMQHTELGLERSRFKLFVMPTTERSGSICGTGFLIPILYPTRAVGTEC